MADNNKKSYIGGSTPKVKPTPTKDFLSRAMLLNREIDRRLGQMQTLRDLAERASGSLSDMPRPATRDVRSRESVYAKLIDLDSRVNEDIDKLIDIKDEIMAVICKLGDPRHQVLLDLRYLRYMTWENIADEFGFTTRSVHRIHGNALKEVELILARR